MRKKLALAINVLLVPLISTFALSLQGYENARSVRLTLGHYAALPLYQQLLQEHPTDITAASRIGACHESPKRHDASCAVLDSDKIQKLRHLLRTSKYDSKNIQSMFGISESHKLACAAGPIYLTPAIAGSINKLVEVSPTANNKSLQCFVSLFLLGLSIHCNVLEKCLIGGRDSVQLLQDLGLAFPCEVDSNLLVPYVHLFPIKVCDHKSLVLATDLHPRVLSTTTVGTREDGTVMYIGPDSLALVRNLPLTQNEERVKQILDLCTGSGVQALSALTRFEDDTSKALCVDINERALRFVQFNAALNGLEDQVVTQQADLLGGAVSPGGSSPTLVDRLRESCREMSSNDSKEMPTFDLILANPPFIPVPPDNDTILQRYGLFSSGGSDGEAVLKAIMKLASQLLGRNAGLLGVVSEFMNPPSLDGDKSLMKRLQMWWSDGPGGRGVLLTNEFPVDAITYSGRRADTRDELDVWFLHLSQLKVTCVSPGLLFMWTDGSLEEMVLQHRKVPKTASGSIWTPSNPDAVVYIRKVIQSEFKQRISSL